MSGISEAPEKETWLARWGVAVVCAVAAVLLYLPSIGHDFVWDDHTFVRANTSLRDWSKIPAYFTDEQAYHWQDSMVQDRPRIYRPVRNISYLIDYKIWGLNPSGFRLQSILLHGIACFLICLLARQLGLSSIACLAAGLVMAAHPAAVEAVVWIKSRDTLLATVFALAAICVMASSRERVGNVAFLILAPLLYLTGLFSYIQIIPILLVPLILPRGVFSKGSTRPLWCWLTLGGAMAFITILFLFVRHKVLGGSSQGAYLADGSFWRTMQTMVAVSWDYFRLTVFPLRLNADYFAYPAVETMTEVRFLLGAAVLIVTAGAGVFAFVRGHRVLGFAIALSLALFLPVSNLVPMMQYLAERFLYMPLVGYALLLGICADRLQNLGDRKMAIAGYAVLGGYLSFFAVRNEVRQRDWKNDVTLFRSSVAASPENCRARTALAEAVYNAGDYEEAAPLLEKAINQCGGLHGIYRSLATSYLELGDFEEARSAALRGQADFPDSPDLLVLRAHAAAQLERTDEVTRLHDEYQRAGQYDPVNDFNMARAMHLIQKYDDARRLYHRHLEQLPEEMQGPGIGQLIDLCIEAGLPSHAQEYCDYFAEIDPDYDRLDEWREKIAAAEQSE